MLIQQPLVATNRNGQYDVICTVSGGGLSGQAGAVRHGLSKALMNFEPDLRGALKTRRLPHPRFARGRAQEVRQGQGAPLASSSPSADATSADASRRAARAAIGGCAMARRIARSAIAACVALAGLLVPAAAQSVEEFYKGRTVTLVISFGAGGLNDIAGRLVAQHLPRFIPGHPRIIAQNMPGAGGLVAANHLYNAAAAGRLGA